MNINAILFPTDFSESSSAALEYASSLASQTGAMLHIVHVADDTPAYLVGYGGYQYEADSPNQLKKKIEARLNEIEPSETGISVRRHYLTGSAVDELIDFAEKEEIDLIVMGTNGRTGWSRALLGSIAEGVLRRSNCPVLTIKESKAIDQDSKGKPTTNSSASDFERNLQGPRRMKLSLC
ncbi:universal stress protein [Adhaeretor mobilis]|uniref:Universal stress protein n=1 Tax=Adhaeretor mobilis TaxID=1930276 RepID=A0A517MXE2_9BACT|nr:universal stress protein [Adhaeretor mobilis]QDS99555.1 Universal stress protein [Adhaeretor mobilis]